MKNTTISIKLADLILDLNLEYSETAVYFKKYIIRKNMIINQNTFLGEIRLDFSEVELVRYPPEYTKNFPYIEYSELIYPVSEMLFSKNKFCFHGLAYLWKGKAYLFTGRSGIGKSTQFRLWKNLYPDEVRIINGDKPILSFCSDGHIEVYPSPWNGKEGWGSGRHAPLGGIISLSWGANKIVKMEQNEAVNIILQQIFNRLDIEENCHKLARLTEQLVNTIPIWNLQNRGDVESAQITHDFLMKELGFEKE